MHDYLSAFFPEYRHPVRINGVIRDFDPDGGIRNLGAAIDVQVCRNGRGSLTSTGRSI